MSKIKNLKLCTHYHSTYHHPSQTNPSQNIQFLELFLVLSWFSSDLPTPPVADLPAP